MHSLSSFLTLTQLYTHTPHISLTHTQNPPLLPLPHAWSLLSRKCSWLVSPLSCGGLYCEREGLMYEWLNLAEGLTVALSLSVSVFAAWRRGHSSWRTSSRRALSVCTDRTPCSRICYVSHTHNIKTCTHLTPWPEGKPSCCFSQRKRPIFSL
jgi:hypothetical protein